jgi:excisionase family DNA binding protein
MVVDDERVAFNVPEVAKKLGISTNSAYERIRQGEIPHIRLGARIVIPKAAFEAWLAKAGA